jgi:hypothetical protein
MSILVVQYSHITIASTPSPQHHRLSTIASTPSPKKRRFNIIASKTHQRVPNFPKTKPPQPT